MPKKEIDYSKIVLYKIVCNDLNVKDLYVGSTVNFRQRKSAHKSHCNNENDTHYNIKIYQTIRDKGGWENWTMNEIEKFSCKDGNEARTRERYWFEELEAKLNTIYPSRSIKEWGEDNKEHRHIVSAKFYEENKDKIKLQHAKNYEKTKEKVLLRSSKNYEKNKEKIKLKRQQNLESNRDEINRRARELYAKRKLKPMKTLTLF